MLERIKQQRLRLQESQTTCDNILNLVTPDNTPASKQPSLQCMLNSGHGSDFVLSAMFQPEHFKATYIHNSRLMDCAICLKSMQEPTRWADALFAVSELPTDQAVRLLSEQNFIVTHEDILFHRSHYQASEDPVTAHMHMMNNIITQEYEKYLTMQQFQFVKVEKDDVSTIVPNLQMQASSNTQFKNLFSAIKLYMEMNKDKHK